jgi:hypothetical protein
MFTQQIKKELQRIHISGCRCERRKAKKAEGSEILTIRWVTHVYVISGNYLLNKQNPPEFFFEIVSSTFLVFLGFRNNPQIETMWQFNFWSEEHTPLPPGKLLERGAYTPTTGQTRLPCVFVVVIRCANTLIRGHHLHVHQHLHVKRSVLLSSMHCTTMPKSSQKILRRALIWKMNGLVFTARVEDVFLCSCRCT